MSLHEATSTAFNFMLNDSLSDGHNESPAQWVEAVQALMRVLVKVLLYIGLPDVRREVHNDRTELLEQMRRLKSPGKRAKLQRKLSKTSDYVVIKAPPVDVSKSDSNGNGTRTVKSHWRRGHLRMQRHGHQLTLSKTVFIAPVLVGMGDAQPAASYVVR